MELYGLNTIGLQRAGFAAEVISALKRAYRIFFNSDLNLGQAHRTGARPSCRRCPRWSASSPSWSHRRAACRRDRAACRSASSGSARSAATTPGTSRHRLRRSWSVSTTSTRSGRRGSRGRCGTAALCRPRRAARPGCEAVTVAVPTPVHAEVGLAALRRGVPVLMEKPLAATRGRGRRPDRRGRAPAGSSCRSGTSSDSTGRCARREPYLDQPRYIESQRLAPFQPRGTDVAVVLDLMIHDLDLILHLTGGAEAMEVRAVGVAVLSPHLDMANARVEFAGGAVAQRHRLARSRASGCGASGSSRPTATSRSTSPTGRGEFMRLRDGWRPGVDQGLADIVERIVAGGAGRPTRSALELQSFMHAVPGRPGGRRHRRGGPGRAGPGAPGSRGRRSAPARRCTGRMSAAAPRES